jgi:uncharacterized protein YacL
LFASLGFLGAVLSLRGNRDDFAFIIPYVRFRQDASSGQPIVLDADAVIDGRVVGILRSGFLHGRLIVPRFVLDDLQAMANSGSTARASAASAVSIASNACRSPDIQVSVHDTPATKESENLNSRSSKPRACSARA